MTASRHQHKEQKARDISDSRLHQSGWVVQDKDHIDFSASTGIAIREYLTDVRPADYALFVDKKSVGMIKRKPPDLGQNITIVEEQSFKNR